MFSTSRLFLSVACPDGPSCTRDFCLFGHKDTEIRPSPRLRLLLPAKRATTSILDDTLEEPPRKAQKSVSGASAHEASRKQSNTTQNAGPPLIRESPASSRVPIPVRQAMLSNIYTQFTELYSQLSGKHPNLAREHALAQEVEVYKQSTQPSYRSAIISAVANIKKRVKPDAFHHPSVGTVACIANREAEKDSIRNLVLSRDCLTPLLLTEQQMINHGYIIEIPPGDGGEIPSLEGMESNCERCGKPFTVKADPSALECTYHWGKIYSVKVPGEKEKKKVLNCCSQESESTGCVRGPHVFYEKEATQLHARFPFSRLTESPGKLDVVALDCEMIYTTAGMRLAHVSIVDGGGNSVIDEPVRLEDGVKVIDFNTRFSGVTSLDNAQLQLRSLQEVLSSSICESTILIGHALENDLKALRLIHRNCVDTAALFPHPGGLPYKRSLKELARQKLGIIIQRGGGSSGHSSLEDAKATLDLVRWYVVDQKRQADKRK